VLARDIFFVVIVMVVPASDLPEAVDMPASARMAMRVGLAGADVTDESDVTNTGPRS